MTSKLLENTIIIADEIQEITTRSCGNNHTNHDWGPDGICRRCGTRWECPPHWFLIEDNIGRCRFCSEEKTFLTRVINFDDDSEYQNLMTFRDYK